MAQFNYGAIFFFDCVIIKIALGLARAQNWEESSESVKFKTSFPQSFPCIYYKLIAILRRQYHIILTAS